MNYQTSSRSQKKASPASSNNSSRSLSAATTEPASVRYFTALANSSTEYESPYAQDRDKRPQPPTTRASTLPYTARSTSGSAATYRTLTPPARGDLSTYSSSSGGSLYTTSRQQQRSTTPGNMNSSKTMSSVSQHFPFVSRETPVSQHCFRFPARFLKAKKSRPLYTTGGLSTSSRFRVIRAPDASSLLASAICCTVPDAIFISRAIRIISFKSQSLISCPLRMTRSNSSVLYVPIASIPSPSYAESRSSSRPTMRPMSPKP